jgi:hypothetical protein
LWLYFRPCALRPHRNFHFEVIQHWLERSPKMRVVLSPPPPTQDQCEKELYVILFLLTFLWSVFGLIFRIYCFAPPLILSVSWKAWSLISRNSYMDNFTHDTRTLYNIIK